MSLLYSDFGYYLSQTLAPICICVVLPVLIVWLVCRVRLNDTNRRTEVLVKALETGTTIDPNLFKDNRTVKSPKERLQGKLTVACVTGFIGIAVLLTTVGLGFGYGWKTITDGPALLFLLLPGGILLAVGIAFYTVYRVGKREAE